MDQVQIPIEGNDESWRQRCNDRMGKLKAKQFPSPDPPSQVRPLQEEYFAEKNSIIFKLQKTVQNGNVDRFVDVLEQLSYESNLPLSSIFDQVTRADDSLLHEAAYFGIGKIAELIGHHFPKLLTKRNIKGDTALHVAARAKNSDVIKVILSQYDVEKSKSSLENKDGAITRLTNEYGNTALHEAVYSKHLDGVTLLFHADKCVAHYLNKSGRSPLYLSVLTADIVTFPFSLTIPTPDKEMVDLLLSTLTVLTANIGIFPLPLTIPTTDTEIVDLLLQAPFPNDKSLPNCHNSPLHAAIYTRNLALLKEIVAKKPDLMYLRDEHGDTPLHYAAAGGYLKGVKLLNEYALIALEWNIKGHLPIHLACKYGHLLIVKELLKENEWSDSRTLLNRKGQNILHIAAKNGRQNVVKYLLKIMKPEQLNEKDQNGDTPLHLASQNPFPNIIFTLTQDKRIDATLVNNKGLTARDTIFVLSEGPMTAGQCMSHMILYPFNPRRSDKAKDILRKSLVPPKQDWIKDRSSSLMLVAILIATVTFAAGFTVPGGVYNSDDPNPHNRGMAVLSKRRMFQIFVVFNTIAMYSSTFGSFILLWTQIRDFHLAVRSFWWALFMVGTALGTMTLAFMAAVRVVVSNISWLANLITILGIIFLSLILCLGIFGNIQFGSRFPFEHQLFRLFNRVSILLYGSPCKVTSNKPKKSGMHGQQVNN